MPEKIVSIALLICAPALLGAATLNVPDDYTTIQNGLNAAADMDTVLVADGTYSGENNTNLDFLGKAVTLLSENGAIAAIIDCADTSRGFVFHFGEGPDSRVEGFTVRNGHASLGGAVVCLASSPTFAECTITGNKAVGSELEVAYGGGIYGSPVITGCSISENLAFSVEWNQGGFGGGMYGAPEVYDSEISGNIAASLQMAGTAGGGAYCTSESASFTNCEISGNMALSFSTIGNASGGGISGSPTLTGCLISDNRVSSAALGGGGSGGGISGSPELHKCIITGNTATGDAGEGEGGGLYGNPFLINCLITDNHAASTGGGIYCRGQSPGLVHCTVTGNRGDAGGGGLFCWSDTEVLNCIIWGNTIGEINGKATVSWSDVRGGYEGEGNIDARPWFIKENDYHLSPYSPCADAAANAGVPTDLDGDPRPLDDGYDMGADEVLKTGAAIRLVPEDFRFLSLDAAPVPDTLLKIYSLGVLPLNYAAESGPAGWLDLSGELTGTIEPGDETPITLHIDPGSLDPGIYRDTVTVTSNDPERPVLRAPVELTVYSQGILNVPGEFETIQAAIDAAGDGDLIMVAAGLYGGAGNYELDFTGKKVTLGSEAGPEETVIDCGFAGCGFRFTSGESQETVVYGFTVSDGGIIGSGGGVQCVGTSPTIENCRITGCSAGFGSGGGIYCGEGASPRILDCEILDNSADAEGGGIFLGTGSGAVLNTSTIRGNEGMERGGGIFCLDSSPLIQRCLIFQNLSEVGGGLGSSGNANPSIVNCTIAENYAVTGCGVYFGSSYGLLVHSTITSNVGTGSGGIVCEEYASPSIVNCIVWRNNGPEIVSVNAYVSYCDVQNGWPGTGNIDADPLFTRPGSSDYHILPASPCVDAARNTPVLSDIDGEDRPFGAAPDIGSDEVTDTAPRLRLTPESFDLFSFNYSPLPDDTLQVRSVGADTLLYSIESPSVSWLTLDGPLSGINPPGDTVLVTLSFDIGELPVGEHSDTLKIMSNDPDQQIVHVPVHLEIYASHTITVPGDAPTIQAGIDLAMDGDTVLVAAGTFRGPGNMNLDFRGKSIVLTSEEGPDSTIIQCERNGRGFRFWSGESPSSVLEGFSILKGYSNAAGGGIRIEDGASPSIRFCRLRQNDASEKGGGISISFSSPALTGCAFIENTGNRGGGAVMRGSDAVFSQCEFRSNEAGEVGGGVLIDRGSPDLVNCIILDNSSRRGAGIYCFESSPVLKCVTMANNDTTGITCVNASPQIIDCIIWNHGISIDLMSGSPSVSWSDIEGGWPGEGNIDADPEFKSGTDFHIERSSPCIDAGIYTGVLIDIDGETRPQGDGYDMGADEFSFYGPAIEIEPAEFEPLAFHPDPEHLPDTLSIKNIGSDELLFNVNQGLEPWVKAEGDLQGTLAPGETAVALLHYFIEGLGTGTYTDTFTVGSNDPVYPLLPVPVTLEILPRELRVPEDYPFIQFALDAALPGQHVLVSPGTYTGWRNRDLDFGGKAVRLIGAGGPEATAIDCENRGRGAVFQSGESQKAVIEGFKFLNGSKQNGGAILCDASSPTIVNCYFDVNTAFAGGGIACLNGAEPVIDFCIFLGNGAEIGGGALFCDAASPEMNQCYFSGNYTEGDGGAVSCVNGAAPALLETVFFGNIGSLGGAVSCAGGASPRLERCVFLENSADKGGGVRCLDGCVPKISSCTFSRNEASLSGGAVFSADSSPLVQNSILWNDRPSEIVYLTSPVIASWSDIEGGWEGPGNIDQDPLFNSPPAGDFTLREGSPCIDAGNPFEDVPFGGGKIIDMGAYEFDQGFTLLETPSPR